ncbi:helix-turn-helix domain-containing protein [Vibrio sp. OPT18]|uniref:helix-turn-helix domain-containing protein n=1 Tax=Vibrio sp. OPT18 TaxID=2778641 RepID=UPI00187E100E|nr:helix-turn-helix domain-containing protein [Vibrio sp. OPT18]MBE8574165.1 helix-turn-helix transcriptional regulator [Vibrio sp. OPT18]
MNIRFRKIYSTKNQTLELKINYNKHHILSSNCSGKISYRGHLSTLSPYETFFIPKKKNVSIFLYSDKKEDIEITLHKHINISSNVSAKFISEYINSKNQINGISEVDLKNKEFILQSLHFYLQNIIENNKFQKSKSYGIIAKITGIIKSDIKRKWSSEDIRKVLFLSESTLYRTLKMEGESLNTLITDARMINAKKLLKTTNLSINEISYESGFNSTSYFSKVFKERYRHSPTEFRNISRNNEYDK